MNGTPSTQHQIAAWRILVEAEEAFGAMRLASRRSAAQKQPPPESIADYLFWIEDSAGVQQTQNLARALQGVAAELRRLGFTPSPQPEPVTGGPA